MRKKRVPISYSGNSPEEIDFTYNVRRSLLPYFMRGMITLNEIDLVARRRLIKKRYRI